MTFADKIEDQRAQVEEVGGWDGDGGVGWSYGGSVNTHHG